jgi:glutamyl-tRNA(Gln) amidotransferase subunit D
MDEGTYVKFSYKGNSLEGTIVLLDGGMLTIKLNSGYNVIVPEGEIEVTSEKKITSERVVQPQLQENPSLPKISILHTGGTIASKVDYSTGAVYSSFEPEELVALFPELSQKANISSRLLSNMSSDDMRFAHYNVIGRAAMDEVVSMSKGVIVTQGTDTLHCTAAALSFMFEGLNKPVVIVGSQRSSDRGSSDAFHNLMGAVSFILDVGAPGVFVTMHESSDDSSIAIIDGLHARKNHASMRGAFESVNAPLVARVKNGEVEIIDQERLDMIKTKADTHPRIMPFNEELKIGWWRAHPQSFVDELKPYDDFDGLIVEGTGLGHLPINGVDEFTREQHPFIREKLLKLAKSIPVAMVLQTTRGRVNMNVYSPGRKLIEMGILGQNLDIPPDTAFIKLAWLLSNYSSSEVRSLYSENLRGEISERSSLN